jgi:hypothetical protein
MRLTVAAALAACVVVAIGAFACNEVEDSLNGAPGSRSTSPNEPSGGGSRNPQDNQDPANDDPPPEDDAGTPKGDSATKSTMTFFVTSTGSGAKGGDLGGLAGADAKCQQLAAAVGGGDHTWRAYLSANANNQIVNAADRIGKGPWKNQKGVVIATDVAALHAAGFVLKDEAVLDEKGQTVPRANPNRHDILTGTNTDGGAHPRTCNNWTSSLGDAGADAAIAARVGHSDSDLTGNGGDRWNSAHDTPGCSQAALNGVGGEGRFYCFATD